MNDWKTFFKAGEMHKKEIIEGDVTRYIYSGQNIQIVEYYFPADKSFPPHSHNREEQMGFLVSGKMGFEIGGEQQDLSPGEWYHAPVGAKHRAWTYDEPSVLVDIFSPPRKDLM